MEDGSLAKLIEAIYEAATTPDLWPSVLAAVRDAFSAYAVTILPLATPAEVMISPGSEAAQSAYADHWWQYDPMARSPIARTWQGLRRDADLIPTETMMRHPFYQEFRRPHGMGHVLFFGAEPLPEYPVALSWQLPGDFGLPSGDELLPFETIGRHVMRAISITGQLEASAGTQRDLGALLANLQHGVALLDRNGLVRYANVALGRLAGRGLTIERGRLRTARMRDQSGLDRMIAGALAPTLAGPEFATAACPGGGPPLLMRAVALPLAGGIGILAGTAVGCRVMVLAVDPAARTRGSAEAPLRALGLTAAEARVVTLIGGGATVPDIAERLGTSPHTVRTQVKTAAAKLGLSRQSELAGLVLRLAPATCDPEDTDRA